jgi:hypothetical protein|tara:strand:+ start:238 stop:645 length:408 start_codon:yes stop_codon:yes gene_type:complete
MLYVQLENKEGIKYMAYVSQKNKAKLAPAIKAVLKKYGCKASISIRNHMVLCVKISSGIFEFGKHANDFRQVNVYHIETHYDGVEKKFLLELLAAMKGPDWFDKSDSQSDYFHVSHYTDIEFGNGFSKPYVQVAA